ncbi:MAG: HPr family phosphocarrier protein, partial [Candidatus Dadabacteria bacterium]|nr:HPr family phosphocarrier protein [Candidatus Dadabacteria bacterium]
GKSILGVLSLAAAKGSTIKVVTRGDDSESAMDEIGALIESGFGEGV